MVSLIQNPKRSTYRDGHLTWRPERVLRGSGEVAAGVEVDDAGPVGGDKGGGGGSTIGVGSVTVGGIAQALSMKAGLRRSTLTFSCLPLMSMVKKLVSAVKYWKWSTVGGLQDRT